MPLAHCHRVAWRRTASGAWHPLYRAERDEVLLARLRSCLGLAFVGIIAWGVQLVLEGPTARGHGLLVAYATVCVGVWTMTMLPVARRRATGLALAYVLILTAGVAALLPQLPEGPAIAAAVLVTTLLGITLLLPWGAAPQAAAGVAAVAAYAWIHWHAAHTPHLAGFSLVVLAAVSALVGAHLLAAYRARIFEHTWQQQQLVALTANLLAQAEPQDVMSSVVEHARRLMVADLAILAEHDPKRCLRRVSAISPPNDDRLGRWLGLEVPDDVALLAPTLTADFLRIPEDDPGGPLAAMLQGRGVHHTLFVAMRSGGARLGNLAIARRTAVPFSPGEEMLARGVADQAALALRNARLVADLREASQLKSQFVSTVSHELRTPLNVILGFSEMGRDPAVEEAERLHCFTHIEMAGRDLLSLIESTLDIGRIEAGLDAVRPEPVALPELWSELAASASRLPRQEGVDLQWSTTVPPIRVVTDPRKLTVVLRNLVGNALKFTESGRVRVELRAENGRLVVRVSDTGIGIRAEDHERIFELFRQADGSDTRRYGGTGLGLYIVRRFVEQLGGTVGVQSAPGEGAVFTVRMPLVLAASQVASAA
jgi:signal transduction histidine kinase